MKATRQFSTVLATAMFVGAAFFSSAVYAQIKAGNNPAIISPSANLEAEVTNEIKVIVRKDNVTRGTIIAWSQQTLSVSYITNQSVQQKTAIIYTPARGEMTIVKPEMYHITSVITSPQTQHLNYSRHCSYIAVNGVQQNQVCSASPDGATVVVSNSDLFSLSAGDKIKVGIGTASTTQGYYNLN